MNLSFVLRQFRFECRSDSLRDFLGVRSPKYLIFEHLHKLLHNKKIPDIKVNVGRKIYLNLSIHQKMLNSQFFPISPNVLPIPYEFTNENQYHVFANHAARHLGGGTFHPNGGFVQEEKITITSSLLLTLAYKETSGKLNQLDIDLGVQPLLILMNILFSETDPKDLYGKQGMTMITKNPSLISKNYVQHKAEPRIAWLCKAVARMDIDNGENYNNKLIHGTPVIYHILLLAIESYCMAIESVEYNNKINEIHIHDGNWGCGAFNHNVNTIFILEHMAISIAISLVNPKKKVYFDYHAYDTETAKKLEPAMIYWKKVLQTNSFKPVEILNFLTAEHKKNNSNWLDKL